jgi:hypothetical protein
VGQLGLSYNGENMSSGINFHRGWYTNDTFISFTIRSGNNPTLTIGSADNSNAVAAKCVFLGGFNSQSGSDYARSRQWATTFMKSGVDMGADNATTTSHVLDVNGHASFNNDLGTSDATMTHVTINTDTSVAGTALTVAGPTYIGDWRATESGAINSAYFSNYNLWVTKGIQSNDFAIATESEWKDDVFEKEYKLPTQKEVENFVTVNKHLPDVPSAEDVKKNGYSVTDLLEHLKMSRTSCNTAGII